MPSCWIKGFDIFHVILILCLSYESIEKFKERVSLCRIGRIYELVGNIDIVWHLFKEDCFMNLNFHLLEVLLLKNPAYDLQPSYSIMFSIKHQNLTSHLNIWSIFHCKENAQILSITMTVNDLIYCKLTC